MHITTCLATYSSESTLNPGYLHPLFVEGVKVPGEKSRVNLSYLIVLAMLSTLLFDIVNVWIFWNIFTGVWDKVAYSWSIVRRASYSKNRSYRRRQRCQICCTSPKVSRTWSTSNDEPERSLRRWTNILEFIHANGRRTCCRIYWRLVHVSVQRIILIIKHPHSTGDPSLSIITARKGRCVANACLDNTPQKPLGSSAIYPRSSPSTLPVPSVNARSLLSWWNNNVLIVYLFDCSKPMKTFSISSCLEREVFNCKTFIQSGGSPLDD